MSVISPGRPMVTAAIGSPGFAVFDETGTVSLARTTSA
jgi:hypothetical protein